MPLSVMSPMRPTPIGRLSSQESPKLWVSSTIDSTATSLISWTYWVMLVSAPPTSSYSTMITLGYDFAMAYSFFQRSSSRRSPTARRRTVRAPWTSDSSTASATMRYANLSTIPTACLACSARASSSTLSSRQCDEEVDTLPGAGSVEEPGYRGVLLDRTRDSHALVGPGRRDVRERREIPVRDVVRAVPNLDRDVRVAAERQRRDVQVRGAAAGRGRPVVDGVRALGVARRGGLRGTVPVQDYGVQGGARDRVERVRLGQRVA